MGDVGDLLVLDRVNRDAAVFVPDVNDDLVYPLARCDGLDPLSQRQDWLTLVPLAEVVGVDGDDDLSVLGALLKESSVSIVEEVKRPPNVDPTIRCQTASLPQPCPLASSP